MLARCQNLNHEAFKRYGGRGIKVCKPWRDSFEAFWSDMGPTYVSGLTLERKKNNLGYSPKNCTWATRVQQARNTRANKYLETPSGRMTVCQAADHYGVKRTTLAYRLAHDWPVLKAIGMSSTS